MLFFFEISQSWDNMNKYVRTIKIPQGVQSLNILLLGLVGSGKSSFIKTCHESLNRDKDKGVQEPPVHIGDAVAGEESVTTHVSRPIYLFVKIA